MFGLSKARVVFADYAAGAPMSRAVADRMAPWLSASWNPSALHTRGVEARAAVERSRKDIAALLFAHPDEIVFTGSGTEALNLAIRSAVAAARASGIVRPRVIASAVEHHAVLEPLRALEAGGAIALDLLPVAESGVTDLSRLKEMIVGETAMVALMAANNEIGTIQPVREAAKIIRALRKSRRTEHDSFVPLFLIDACQAFPALVLQVERLGADYLAMNGAKLGGPHGIGLLYARRGTPIEPMVLGGGQESGRRSGTENVAGIVGLAAAMEERDADRESLAKRLPALRNELERALLKEFPDIHVNGRGERLPGHLNITVPGADHQYLALSLSSRGVLAGTKSACRENDDGDSHVLAALRAAGDAPGLPPRGVRISLGAGSIALDVPAILSAFRAAVPLSRKSREETFR